jgi:hypothetical protein
MKQFIESVIKLPATIKSYFRFETSNSHNDSYSKIENHFHGTVNFIGKQDKKLDPPHP